VPPMSIARVGRCHRARPVGNGQRPERYNDGSGDGRRVLSMSSDLKSYRFGR
jgi:hypothetical protein